MLDGHLSTSTAQQLADKVPVWTDSGETWGTLADWFRAASERRPPIAVEPLNDLETAREAFGIQTGPFPAELDDKESPSSGSGGSQREVEPPDGEYRDCAKWVLRHMRAAWMAVGVHAPLQVHLVSSARSYKLRTHSVVPERIGGMDISCVVELDQEHPLVLSATHGNSRAMTLLLLEVANVAGAWLEAQGDRDLVQSLHQYLMAQRVIQAG